MKLYIHAAEDVDKRKLARNSTDPEILTKLADDEDYFVRGYVAGNKNTPPEISAKLADDEDDYVRAWVAGSWNTPPEILAKLADDEAKGVRENVAKNSKTPSEALVKLADDEDKYIRKCVADNENTPSEIKEKLTQKSKKTKWQNMIDKIQSEGEDGIDSLYEQTEAGEYIENLQEQVENKLGVWLEPSIQGGQGGIWIRSNKDDSTLAEDIDYEGFNEDVLDTACESKNKTEFMNWYKSYLESLIEK